MILKQPKYLLLKPSPLIIFLGILQLIIVLLSAHLNFDEAMWHYIGHNWFTNGLTPYRGGVDNKSPLIFAIFGLSDKLFGVNDWFPKVLGTVCQSIGIYYLYRIAKYFAGELCGIISITIYGLSLLWRSTDGGSVSFTETYEVTFVIIASYYFLTSRNGKRFFVAGLIASIGVAFRFSGFFAVAAMLLSMFGKQKKIIIPFCIGVVSGLIIFLLLIVLTGIPLSDFIFYSFTENFENGSVTDITFLQRLSSFMNTFFYSEIVLFYPFILIFLFLKNKNNFIIAWLICEFIGISIIGSYATTHFKDIIPVMSLMSAISLAYLVENYYIPVKPVIIICWICFFPKLINPFMDLKHLIFPPGNVSEKLCTQLNQNTDDNAKKFLGVWINANTLPGDKVFVAGYGAIVQAYSGRQSTTIYFNVTQTKAAKTKLFSDLINYKPALMAIPKFSSYGINVNADIRTFIDSLASQQYNFETCMYGYGIYRLKK